MDKIGGARSWRFAAVAVALLAFGTADAKEPQAYVSDAEQFIAKGDLRAAAVELRGAVRQSPDDPSLHARLAVVLERIGDYQGAEREALAARQSKGDEAVYLPPLTRALLQQKKFADILRLITPGDRPPALESTVRVTLGLAEMGLHQPDKAEARLREAVQLDKAPESKIVLARFLSGKSPAEAETLLDKALAAAPEAADALQLKGELLRNRGDTEGAMRLFDKAIKKAPNFMPALLSRANLNIALNRFDAAGADIKRILTALPGNVQANYLLAYALAKQGEFAAADNQLNKVRDDFGELPEGYLLKGGVKFALGEYAAAEGNLKKYLAYAPDDARAVRLVAAIALRRGLAAQAIAYLKPLIEKAPPEAATLALLGNAYTADGKPELALQQFEKAASLDPENPQIQHDVAISEIRTGQNEKGLAELERIFEGKSGATVAGPTLVLTELSARHVDKAAKFGEALVAKDPKNPLFQTVLGLVRAAQKDYPAAEAAFRNAIALAPGVVSPARNLAQLYITLGRANDAKAVYDNFLAKQPNSIAALLGRANIAVTQKDWLYAINTLNRAREIAPSDPEPALRLVAVYLMQQDWNSAKELSAKLAAQFPSNTEVLEMQGQAQVGSGDQSGAVATYKRAYGIAPNSFRILSRYLQLLVEAKDFVGAKAVLESVIVRTPGNVAPKVDMIRLVAASDGLDAAVEKARSFADADPASSTYDLVTADLYEKADRKPEALTVLEKALAQRPTVAAAAIALAGLYNRTNEPRKAEALLEERLRSTPDDLTMTAALASLYMEAKNFDAAIAQYSRIAQKNPKDPAVLNNLASIYQQVGDLDKARHFAEQAVTVAPQIPQIADTLGWILLAQGESDKAVSYLTAANRSAPSELEIQYHLAVALHRVGRAGDAEKMLHDLLDSGKPFSSRSDAEKLLQKLERG